MSSKPVEGAEERGSRSEGPEEPRPRPGVALCLSGGGYRSMVFHLGALRRLNEVGFLPRIDQLSSVSAGSVVAGVFAYQYPNLQLDQDGVAHQLEAKVERPVRELVSGSLDAAAILGGALTLGPISEKLVEAYRRQLFGAATLRDLPERPICIFTATNVQSGGLFSFSKALMRDPRVGVVRRPEIPLAVVVAAASAVPPFFSPVHMEVDASDYDPDSGQELHCAPYTTDVFLTNGGFLDKLALQTAWWRYRTILVSDGGALLRDEPEPRTDWVRHGHRLLELLDREERRQRKRWVVDAFRRGERTGAYWGIRSDIEHFQLGDALACPRWQTQELARAPSRLKRLDVKDQERLINWGYAVTDAALRKHVDPSLPAPKGFPYPESAVGVG